VRQVSYAHPVSRLNGATNEMNELSGKAMAEREGFPACKYADCTLRCWEGQSTLCYTARGWKGKSYGQQSAVEPLDLRFFDLAYQT